MYKSCLSACMHVIHFLSIPYNVHRWRCLKEAGATTEYMQGGGGGVGYLHWHLKKAATMTKYMGGV